jgi:hypothetical protein
MPGSQFTSILHLLRRTGFLLKQDKVLPNVVALMTGETLSRSWWDHPRGRAIFRCLAKLAEHEDVLQTKLVAGKVTFVHRRLWPALLAAATAGAPWQFTELSRAGRTLYKKVQAKRHLIASGPAAKELERRLLVRGEQVHTDAGSHETQLETWSTWAWRVGFTTTLNPEEGQRQLELAVRKAAGRGNELPWQHASRKRKRGSSH